VATAHLAVHLDTAQTPSFVIGTLVFVKAEDSGSADKRVALCSQPGKFDPAQHVRRARIGEAELDFRMAILLAVMPGIVQRRHNGRLLCRAIAVPAATMMAAMTMSMISQPASGEALTTLVTT
jgi:hypothetical protein